MNSQEWERVPGHPAYEISTLGNIRSWLTHRGQPGPRILQPGPDNKGYLTTVLRKPDGGKRTWKVHVLMALTYLGPRPAGQEVRHFDGDNQNNRIGNLLYGTPTENMADRVRHKTHCKQGHRFNDANTYMRPSGGRDCRACMTAADVRRRPRKAVTA